MTRTGPWALHDTDGRQTVRLEIADQLDALRSEHATALSQPTETIDVAELRQLLDGRLDFPDDEKRHARS